jgi:hypothetical protein
MVAATARHWTLVGAQPYCPRELEKAPAREDRRPLCCDQATVEPRTGILAQAAATHFPSRHPNATASGSSSIASRSRSTACAWRSFSGDENPFSTNTLFPCNSMTFALTPSSSGAVGCNLYSLWRFSRRRLKLGRAHHQGVAASVQARGGKKRAALTATRSWAVGLKGEVKSPARIAPAGLSAGAL